MHADVVWKATTAEHPARRAARASMDAVVRGAKQEWLALFAPDAVIQDPVGESPLDPTGLGHHGREGIEAFWDSVISTAERLVFHVLDSFAAGDEVANTGFIRTHLPDGSVMDAEGVFVYRVDDQGRLVSMRAFWEFDRAMTTLHKP
ncbi:nuclear transport factor 2 family protein [Saccharopolyspora gloriosae]|uniref:Ketosteroid isomerase-like protein n=1 Tax=Saccharopolyspora gloriosae TaxID=455344 RepID=A0A840NM68_9PSEU|nr:nuclear transport factor 2 family protein [Saccharopolyspora gloriosae]MBB5069347.1 ketosteroid isomerase-like protein [Saccharopolyspora gloriosae]